MQSPKASGRLKIFFCPQAGLRRRAVRPSSAMDVPQLAKWQAQLAKAQTAIAQLGPMRPGSLSRQYRDPAHQTGPFWQLSYTHNMRSRSRYVRPEDLPLTKPSSPTSSVSAFWLTAASTSPSRSPIAKPNYVARPRPTKPKRPRENSALSSRDAYASRRRRSAMTRG